VWSPHQTYEGAQKARCGINFPRPEQSTVWWFMNKILGLLGKEEFIKEGGTHEREKVSMDFMLFHQKVRAHFRRGVSMSWILYGTTSIQNDDETTHR